MRFKKLMIVFFLALFALAVCVVNVVNKASDPPSNVAYTPRYTPSEIKSILDNNRDAKDPVKIFGIFRGNGKIPVSEVEGLNDTEIVKQLLTRYLDQFRALPPEHSLYIKGYTIDMVYRKDLSLVIPMIFAATLPETAKNNKEIFRVYFNILGAIPRTASDKQEFRVHYTIIPYKEFNTRMVGNPPDDYRVPVINSEFNPEWIAGSVGVSEDGTGLTKSHFLRLSKDNDFYEIGSVSSGP